MDFKKTKEFFQSKVSDRVLWIIGGVVIALVIFQAGMFVGYKKASFSYRFGDNYYRMFGDERGGPLMGMKVGRGMGFFPPDDMAPSHGANGRIISVKLPTIVIDENNGIEKVVLLKDDTVIRRFKENLKSSDLKVDDFIVVIGSPNDDGQIEAKLVRFLPAPPDFFGASSSSRFYKK